MQPDDIISAIRDYYAGYHNQKENMAYAAAVVYISAATAIILNPRGVFSNTDHRCIIAATLVAAFLFGHAFIFWQLMNRELAANVVRAANVVLARLASSPQQQPNMAATEWCSQSLPAEVVTELSNRSFFLGGSRTATVLTLAATVLLSVLALLALTC